MASSVITLIFFSFLYVGSSGHRVQYAPYHDPHCGGKQVIVHLFGGTWPDIAAECERYLGPKGFCGLQVSPPNEHCVITQNNDRPWWQRYQPVSYKLVSRSGNEAQFRDMVTRCKKVGVRLASGKCTGCEVQRHGHLPVRRLASGKCTGCEVQRHGHSLQEGWRQVSVQDVRFRDMVTRCKKRHADIVLNHMAGTGRSGTGSAGSSFNSDKRDFPGVPFTVQDFHTRAECPSGSGNVDDYNDPKNVRNCNLVGLVDINGSHDRVRKIQAAYLNHLIDIGVAGFRSDASKHMWPADIAAIQNLTKNLPEGGRPVFFHEVVDYNTGAVRDYQYFTEGWVTEFRYSTKVRDGADDFGNLRSVYDKGWGMSPPDQAFVYVDNHDSQRAGSVLTYKDGARYKRAQAFTLAYNYGFTRVMSSYYFTDRDAGPPHNADFSTKNVTINPDGTCGNGWVCEHRWKPIGNMARFRTAVADVPQVSNWNTADNILSFNRGNRGFFAMGKSGFNVSRQTGMAPGQYCDLISDCKVKVNVDGSGNANISPADQNDPFVAIIAQKV
ncbi:hypothetical protein RRG08_043156 [Elysia crispata]|uniref:alpha-amylase n=1 Tax=Elysia crispata TaxID=231223 RepID=A0AAE1AR60_9GAST|nr:hypothetical protein RRG08_043156 [Elysia crispata]